MTIVKHRLDDAKSEITKLNNDISSIIVDQTSKNYIAALQKASNDKNIHIDVLIKNVLWTIIVNLNSKSVTKSQFVNELIKIQIGIAKLAKNNWKQLFDINGNKLNLDDPGNNDDFKKILTGIGIAGEIVTLLAMTVMALNWKVNGVPPFRFIRSLIQTTNPNIPDGEAEGAANAGETIEAENVEIGYLDIAGEVLGAIGALLLIVGAIIEAVELSHTLDKIKGFQKDYNHNYTNITKKLSEAISSSEAFRSHASS